MSPLVVGTDAGEILTGRAGVTRPRSAPRQGDFLVEQVIDGPTQLGGEDAERLALAAFLLLALEPLLGPLALAEKETRLREGPTQPRVADLLAAARERRP